MRQGHAFEARLYAESPVRGFLPSPGTLRRWRPPPAAAAFAWDADVRVDSGVQEGDAVRLALAAWCTVILPAKLTALVDQLAAFYLLRADAPDLRRLPMRSANLAIKDAARALDNKRSAWRGTGGPALRPHDCKGARARARPRRRTRDAAGRAD
jgi:hypothetical protein